jgi:hypothetical protein
MANGFTGSAAEWARMEAPLRELDDTLAEFASQHRLSVTRGDKWPDRSIRWHNDISRMIQIFLEDEDLLTFNLWLCAYQDRQGRRYWKQETSIRAQRVAQFKDGLSDLLADAYRKLQSWTVADLAFATSVAK